jgi:hypothetical protein
MSGSLPQKDLGSACTYSIIEEPIKPEKHPTVITVDSGNTSSLILGYAFLESQNVQSHFGVCIS